MYVSDVHTHRACVVETMGEWLRSGRQDVVGPFARSVRDVSVLDGRVGRRPAHAIRPTALGTDSPSRTSSFTLPAHRWARIEVRAEEVCCLPWDSSEEVKLKAVDVFTSDR